ncbi:unnamed protein product, partial [Rotaria sp. Silwood1]
DINIQGSSYSTLKYIHAYAKENLNNLDNNEPKAWHESFYKFYLQLNYLYKQIIHYVWRFGELHSYKLVLFIMVLISVLKISAFNMILMILTTIGLSLLHRRSLINIITLIITSLYILTSMCYQLEIVNQLIIEKNVYQNCSRIHSNVRLGERLYLNSADVAEWFGLKLTSKIDQFLGLYILLTIVLTFDAIVQYRQRHRRLTLSVHFNVHLVENPFSILFEPFALKDVHDNSYTYDFVDYKQANENMINFLKYLANFIFYRFGLEICYITIIIVISIRLDVMAMMYLIWLGIFLISSRRFIQRIWSIYIFFHIIVFPVQYMSAVGAPPNLGFEYPWLAVNFNSWPQLKRWLYLPDYVTPPIATHLIADFFQFLFACQQWRVFVYETNEEDRKYAEAGGSNYEIIHDNDVYKNNRTSNFVTDLRNWLDYFKYEIFMYGIWSVVLIMYLTGTWRIDYLRFGYLMACIYFLWDGQNFLIKHITVILRLDGLCMMFLLLQKRIFASHYWQYIVTELDSQAKFVSQGGILFNEMLCKQREEDDRREEQTVMKTIQNLKYIKEQHLRLNQSDSKVASKLVEPSEHFEAIRSGDYYMFNYKSNEEEDEGKQDKAIDILEQFFRVLSACDKDAAVAVAIQKHPISPVIESNSQKFTTSPSFSSLSLPLAATTITTTMPLLQVPIEITSVEPKEIESKKKEKLIFIKIRLIGEIITDYFIDLFNQYSHDYRKVSRKLAKMKSEDKVIQRECIQLKTNDDKASVIDMDKMADNNHPDRYVHLRKPSQPIDINQRSRPYRLFNSLFYFIMSQSELLCYSAMIIKHLTLGGLLSMLLPLSIFLWTTLSPRPSRNYWIAVLIYTHVMIGITYLYQIQFYDWNIDTTDAHPLSVINIIGVTRKETAFSIADLFLFSSLFLHRSILMQLGLWKAEQTTLNDSTSTDVNHSERKHESNEQSKSTRIKSYFMTLIKRFHNQLQQPLFVRDFYVPMFFCDFINIILVISFYSAFGEQTGVNFVQTIKENRVPLSFVGILLIQFIFIIIDRALYLRCNVYGKLCFQLFQVIIVHIWLFLVLPNETETKFRDNCAAQFWYVFKCIYFGCSSIQIRSKYPKHRIRNALMQSYILIPFFLELRTLMNWMFTDTALDLSNWLQLEDIYSKVYLLKCARWAEKIFPTERGKPRSKTKKYGLGGLLLVLLILLIWFPLVIFSITSSFYRSNPPKEINIEIKLGDYLPIYQMTAQNRHLIPFTLGDYNRLRSAIYSSKIKSTVNDNARAFLRRFHPNDILCANFFATSFNIWELNQPIRDTLVNNLQTNITVPVQFTYTITHNSPDEDTSESQHMPTIIRGQNTVDIELKDKEIRKSLIDILNKTFDAQKPREFKIYNLMPRFLRVKAKGKPKDIKVFNKIFPAEYYAHITMSLNETKSISNSSEVWWEMTEDRTEFKVTPSCELKRKISFFIYLAEQNAM